MSAHFRAPELGSWLAKQTREPKDRQLRGTVVDRHDQSVTQRHSIVRDNKFPRGFETTDYSAPNTPTLATRSIKPPRWVF